MLTYHMLITAGGNNAYSNT